MSETLATVDTRAGPRPDVEMEPGCDTVTEDDDESEMSRIERLKAKKDMNLQYMSMVFGQARAGQLGVRDIGPIALNVGVGVIVVALVALILSGFGDATSDGSVASDVVNAGLEAMNSFSGWFDIIVTVAAAAIILGLIIGFAGFVMARRGGGNGAGV